jgi:hypothetical protein
MRRLIIFLIRLKFGLKAYEKFKFSNQKTDNWYYFTRTGLTKYEAAKQKFMPSNVKFNWLMDDKCKIIRIERGEY